MKKIVISICCFLMMPLWANAAEMLVVSSSKGEPYATLESFVLQSLAKKGWVEGTNLHIKKWSTGNAEGLAKRIWLHERENRYDVVFINGTGAAMHFGRFLFKQPAYKVVFGSVTDPVGLGLVKKDFSPVANFTGVCYPVEVRQRLRFLMQLMPNAKNIGYVYSDMAQSHSYLGWLQEVLAEDEFSHLMFHFRQVPFVEGEYGHIRMARIAKQHVSELDGKVDVFLSPNDQLGVQQPFIEILDKNGTKPLIGLGRKDVVNSWGAVASLYPSLQGAGEQIAEMVDAILQGEAVENIPAQWPKAGVVVDFDLIRKFGLTVSEEILHFSTLEE